MLAGVVLRLGEHGLDRRRLAAPCPAPRRAENIAPRAGRIGAKRAMLVGRFMSS
jgi:hypothetical protein